MISSNLGIEFGQSNAGNQEYFRVIAADFGTNTASTTGIPVQVADIGFDIIDATLYRITADILRNGDGSVQLDVTVEDANSSDVYVMPTLNLNASDAAALFVSYDEAGFRQRGWGTQIADNLSITYQPVPEPGSLALISISAVLAMKRRRR